MASMKAEILREYGPFDGVSQIGGVSYDGEHVWLAAGDRMVAVDPESGDVARSLDLAAHAGTAFDGKHLFQIAEKQIHKIDPQTGRVLASIPAPGNGGDSGLAWAEGSLWVGHHRERKITRSIRAPARSCARSSPNRFVTGVTWVDGDLWHGTWEGDESELRRIDPQSGKVLEALELPAGVNVSGLEADGKDRFYCGGGGTGKVRAVRRPKR